MTLEKTETGLTQKNTQNSQNALWMQVRRSPYSLYLVAGLSVLVAALSMRFLFLDLATAAPGLTIHVGVRELGFYLHVAGASIALLVGPFQFFENIRNRFPMVHRSLGIVYLGSCLIGGLSGVYIGFYTPHGPVAAVGFMILGMLWPLVSAAGLYHIIRGNLARHRRWMIRSFSLTFAAVTLRIYLPPMFAYEMDPVIIFSILAWISWLPNLYIANRFLTRATVNFAN